MPPAYPTAPAIARQLSASELSIAAKFALIFEELSRCLSFARKVKSNDYGEQGRIERNLKRVTLRCLLFLLYPRKSKSLPGNASPAKIDRELNNESLRADLDDTLLLTTCRATCS